ncbi:MAG: NAD-binding protein [Thermodesulfobacteriota bacterium]|nr:NAD-binding protein [Thermodesulfobacteriota bacterium]
MTRNTLRYALKLSGIKKTFGSVSLTRRLMKRMIFHTLIGMRLAVLLTVGLMTFSFCADLALGAKPIKELFDDDPTLRQQTYQNWAKEIEAQLQQAQGAEEKKLMLLQKQFLERLKEISDSPGETNAGELPEVVADQSYLTWQNWVLYLNRFVGMIRQETKTREEIKEAEIQLKDMEKELSALSPEQPYTMMVQLQHAYQMRKLRLTEAIARQMSEQLESTRKAFPDIIRRVRIDPSTNEKIRSELEMAKKKLSGLEEENKIIARFVALEQQEIPVPLDSEDPSSKVRQLLKRYNALKLYKIQINKFVRESLTLAQRLAVLENNNNLLWIRLLGNRTSPNSLLVPNENNIKETDQIRDDHKKLLITLRQIKSELFAFKAESLPTGPKATDLYEDLAGSADNIAVEVTANDKKAALLEEKSKLFLRAVTIKQSVFSSVITRTFDTLGVLWKKTGEFFRYPVLGSGRPGLSIGDVLRIILILSLGALIHRFYGQTTKLIKSLSGWQREGKTEKKRLSPELSAEGWRNLRWDSLNLRRRVKFDAWFPHIPLGITVGLFGLLVLWRVYGNVFGVVKSLSSIQALPRSMFFTTMEKLSETAGGIMLILMSIGLMRRSRFIWFVTLLLSVAMAVAAYFRPYSHYLMWASLSLLAFLLIFKRHFKQVSIAVGSLFALCSVLVFLVYGIFGSYILGQEFNPPIDDFASSLYFTIVTMSTVGYGEITPRTLEARLFVVSLIILGIMVFATSITTVIAPLIGSRLRRIMESKGEKMERKDHIILTGNTPLAHNTFEELKKRDIPITVIVPTEAGEEAFLDADVIIGDPTAVKVLRLAGLEKAQAVMALGNDDSENAFVVLAAKEVEGTAKAICAVNDSKNINKVRRVRPDMLIAPQVLGGELLAMAMSGETPDLEILMKRMFNHE